jgi:exopolyphosphatase/guanosine-5'-triphosphate,3'-diphosphate pyrophosphatase
LRVATIDIGTNSVLLLVADTAEQGGLVATTERCEITRLGEGVDKAKTLLPQAIERTLACLRDYATTLGSLNVDALDVVGTSAMRDAGRGGGDRASDFIRRATEILGVTPRVISGEEEASLTFAGGVLGLGLSGPLTAFDVGGGSTEVIRGLASQEATTVQERASLDVGSVRLFERLVRADPPSVAELASVRDAVEQQLAELTPPPRGEPLVGMAGTVTTLAAVTRAIDPYDSARVHGLRISATEITATGRRLAAQSLAERQKIAGLQPKRADVIPIGAIIVESVLRWAQADELIVSDRGVRWGLAMALASSTGRKAIQ